MSEHVLIRLAAIVVLGIGTQWLAWRLRLPSILLLLLVGFAAGAGTEWLAGHGLLLGHRFLNPDELLGDLLLPAVSLSVALILFEGGLTLNLTELWRSGGVIRRLVSMGALVTWLVSLLAARWILGLDWSLAILLGAILVVTGPTVIGPLLRHVRPVGPVGAVLKWEGIVIDPIGAMLAVVVFEAIAVGQFRTAAVGWIVLNTVLMGTGLGLAGAALIVLLLRRMWVPDYLQNPLALMTVVAVFAVSNLLQHESGLFAVTAMGLALANQRLVDVRHIMEFKESLTVMLLSVLFIVLGARLELEQLTALDWRSLVFVGVLVIVARPLAVAVCTVGSKLNWRERLFVAAMAPRGIVAAAVSSVFALRLTEQGQIGAEQLVPLTFAVIIATVSLYGLTAPWLARRLGLSKPGAMGFLVVGANHVARAVAQAIHKEGYQVLMVDTNHQNVQSARLAGLPVIYGSILSQSIMDRLELSGIGRLLALTPNEQVNSLAGLHYGRVFGRSEIYQPAPPQTPGGKPGDKISPELRGRILFSPISTFGHLAQRLGEGATIKKTGLTREFGYEQFRHRYGESALPMFLISETGAMSVVTADKPPAPKAGQAMISLVSATAPAPAPPPAEVERTA